MGASPETVSNEKNAPSRGPQHAGAIPAMPAGQVVNDPVVERLVGTGSLAVPHLTAPVLQRAQRLCGNRASQHFARRAGVLQRQCRCGGTCAKCREEEKRVVQRFEGIPSGHGEPIGLAARRPLEAHFRADLADVRLHTGSDAADSARSMDALAYTTGRDIYFAQGMYAPSSGRGQRLLAHEVAHVIQQSAGKEPAIAAKSSSGVKIGAPDDSLEDEAEKKADEYMAGEPPPEPYDQHALELAVSGSSHRSSASIQRQEAPGTSAPASPQTAPPAPTRPKPGAADVWFQGVHLADDKEWVREEMRHLIGRHGLKGMDLWYRAFTGSAIQISLPFSAHARAFGGLRPRTPLDVQNESSEENVKLLKSITPLVTDVYVEVRAEALMFLASFEKAAKVNVLHVLETQENQAKAEGLRYGITSETIQKIRYRSMGKGPPVAVTENETRYHMGKDSPSTQGLQAAAKVLLDRRSKIQQLEKDMASHVKLQSDPTDPKGRILVPDGHYFAIGKTIEAQKANYDQLRSVLSADYPALAAFSGLDKGVEGLRTVAEKGPGADTAALVGAKIDEVLRNIEKTRDGINGGDINVWRLPKFVDVTSVQLVGDDKMKRTLVADKREDEQPGVWQDIALLALNIGALVLAAPTGGASLAVSAGVNVAVAAVHVDEYLMKEAMAGTAFDKAQAISQDDPSLFWLAVEIVGAAADVGAASGALIKTFKTLQPLVKTAQAAAEGEGSVKAIQAVELAAKAEEGETFAKRVVARLKTVRGGSGTEVLEAAGATEQELKSLQKVASAAELEAGAGIGKAVKSAGGEISVSKSGRVWSCHSPCELLREKYANVFARSDVTSSGFLRDLEVIEAEAEKAAAARKAAQTSNKAGDLAKAEAMAEKVKTDAAALEQRLLKAFPNMRDVTATRAEIIKALGEFVESDSALANIRKLDPNAKIGVQGSVVRGTVGNPRKATFGQAVNLEDFDLDVFIVSEKLPIPEKVVPLAGARDRLARMFPDLFQGLRESGKGLSVKIFRSEKEVPLPHVFFNK